MSDWASQRCTTCLRNWPLTYKACPVCECENRESNEDPIDNAEAKSLKAHADFDRYCEKHTFPLAP